MTWRDGNSTGSAARAESSFLASMFPFFDDEQHSLILSPASKQKMVPSSLALTTMVETFVSDTTGGVR